jgi:hypothetical protein
MTGADIPGVSFNLGLLMIVRVEAGNPSETPPLHHRWSRTGRLSVDVDFDP